MCVCLTRGRSSAQHKTGKLRSSSIAFIGNSLHVNPLNLPNPNFRDYKYIYKKKGSVKYFLQFLQEQRKHLQSGLNLRRAITFCLFIEMSNNYNSDFIIMSGTKPNLNKSNRRGGGGGGNQWPNEISKVLMITAQEKHRRPAQHSTDIRGSVIYIYILHTQKVCWVDRVEGITKQVVEPKYTSNMELSILWWPVSPQSSELQQSSQQHCQWIIRKPMGQKSTPRAGVEHRLVTEPGHAGETLNFAS